MYKFYFDYDLLPINPAKLTTSIGNKNKVIDLISTGEFNILKDIPLRDFSIKILLPGVPYPFVHTIGDFQKPIFYLNKFRQYKENKKPVRLVITRELPNGEEIFSGNLLVSFEEYSVEENAGEEGDFWVDLKLKEYREIIAIIQEIQSIEPDGTPVVTETTVRPSKTPAGEHTVQSGESLWAIAKRELNDGSRYMEIAQLNGIQDPDKIVKGQVLKLPGSSIVKENAVSTNAASMKKTDSGTLPVRHTIDLATGSIDTEGSYIPLYRGGGGTTNGGGAGRYTSPSSVGGNTTSGSGAGRYTSQYNVSGGTTNGSGAGRNSAIIKNTALSGTLS